MSDEKTRREVFVPRTQDAKMIALAKAYKCPVNEVYRRAVDLYLTMQDRVSTGTGWPHDEPGQG